MGGGESQVSVKRTYRIAPAGRVVFHPQVGFRLPSTTGVQALFFLIHSRESFTIGKLKLMPAGRLVFGVGNFDCDTRFGAARSAHGISNFHRQSCRRIDPNLSIAKGREVLKIWLRRIGVPGSQVMASRTVDVFLAYIL